MLNNYSINNYKNHQSDKDFKSLYYKYKKKYLKLKQHAGSSSEGKGVEVNPDPSKDIHSVGHLPQLTMEQLIGEIPNDTSPVLGFALTWSKWLTPWKGLYYIPDPKKEGDIVETFDQIIELIPETTKIIFVYFHSHGYGGDDPIKKQYLYFEGKGREKIRINIDDVMIFFNKIRKKGIQTCCLFQTCTGNNYQKIFDYISYSVYSNKEICGFGPMDLGPFIANLLNDLQNDPGNLKSIITTEMGKFTQSMDNMMDVWGLGDSRDFKKGVTWEIHENDKIDHKYFISIGQIFKENPELDLTEEKIQEYIKYFYNGGDLSKLNTIEEFKDFILKINRINQNLEIAGTHFRKLDNNLYRPYDISRFVDILRGRASHDPKFKKLLLTEYQDPAKFIKLLSDINRFENIYGQLYSYMNKYIIPTPSNNEFFYRKLNDIVPLNIKTISMIESKEQYKDLLFENDKDNYFNNKSA